MIMILKDLARNKKAADDGRRHGTQIPRQYSATRGIGSQAEFRAGGRESLTPKGVSYLS